MPPSIFPCLQFIFSLLLCSLSLSSISDNINMLIVLIVCRVISLACLPVVVCRVYILCCCRRSLSSSSSHFYLFSCGVCERGKKWKIKCGKMIISLSLSCSLCSAVLFLLLVLSFRWHWWLIALILSYLSCCSCEEGKKWFVCMEFISFFFAAVCGNYWNMQIFRCFWGNSLTIFLTSRANWWEIFNPLINFNVSHVYTHRKSSSEQNCAVRREKALGGLKAWKRVRCVCTIKDWKT